MTPGGYQTSSKEVKALIARDGLTAFRLDDLIVDSEIHIPFGMSVADYETWFLQHNDCAGNLGWINKHNNDGINFASSEFKIKSARSMLLRHGVSNPMLIPSAKAKVVAALIGNSYGKKKRSKETCERLSGFRKGLKKSESHRAALSAAKTGSKATDETKQRMSERKTGVPRPDSWHIKMAEYRASNPNPMQGKVSSMRGKQFPTITCEHCGKEASKGNYLRWHSDNCKQKALP